MQQGSWNRWRFLGRFVAQLVLICFGSVVHAADQKPLWSADTTPPITGKSDPRLASFDKLITDFLREHQVPGAALAVARNGKLVYSRGFGYSDVAKKEPVDPDALFRIASISKPVTAVAVMQLVEQGKLKLDDPAFKLLDVQPHLEPDAKPDPRLAKITIGQLLRHTGGFDRGASFDPMFRPLVIASATKTPAPASQDAIIRYMLGRQLDFDPGTREAYSNFGYCVLGRVMEKLSGVGYEQYVKQQVLEPLGIRRMRLGKSLEKDRAAGEVRYYPHKDRQAPNVFVGGAGDDAARKPGPAAYGGWCIESMDAHGGWISSAPQLVRLASALDDRAHCPILKEQSIQKMFERPKDTGFDKEGKPTPDYYACGWKVRPIGDSGKANTWHAGLLDGTSTLLVRRHDGLTWAVLFNTDRDANGKTLSGIIDPLVHRAADAVKEWPEGWAFKESEPNNPAR